MNSLFNLLTVGAVNGQNRRLRGERHSIISAINPEQNLLVLGGYNPARDREGQSTLAVRESFLHAQISLMLESDVGGILLCADRHSFEALWQMYHAQEKMLFFGKNAFYQYMRGTTPEAMTKGLRELMSAYREANPGAPYAMENVFTQLIKLPQIASFQDFEDLCEGFDTGSVSGFMQHAEETVGPLPHSIAMMLNNHWNAGVPAFVDFRDKLAFDLNRARAENGVGYGAAQAVYSKKIAVFCVAAQDELLKNALSTEMLWLSTEGYAFDLVTFHAALPSKQLHTLLSTSTEQMRFCAIASALAEISLDLASTTTMRPAVVCLGAMGDDARRLSEFYNTNYRETQTALTLGRGIFAGFHQAMVPELDPSVLTPKNIMLGGGVILNASGFNVTDYLFVN